MYFGFALDSSDIDLWDIDLSDTDLDFLDTVNIFFVSKTSWRRIEDMSWRRLEGMSSKRLQEILGDEKLLRWRRVEDVFKTSWIPSNVC